MRLDNVLDNLAQDADQGLAGIVVIDLSDGEPLAGSKQTTSRRHLELYKSIWGDDSIGGIATKELRELRKLQQSLNSLGKDIDAGKLKYSIFRFEQDWHMMTYFMELTGFIVALCFIASEDMSIGRYVNRRSRSLWKAQ